MALGSARCEPRRIDMTHSHTFPNGRCPAVTILLNDEPRRAMQAHALTRLDREVAGVMVGPWPRLLLDGHYLVEITDYIVGRYAIHDRSSVRLTPEFWRYANIEQARRYPGNTTAIVGWVHTHPGFGVFLSEPDLFIHRAFFRQPWQVAAVVDPAAHTGGFFGWDVNMGDVWRDGFVWHWG
jgi:proteasome lid subunit RPN8/RPN11